MEERLRTQSKSIADPIHKNKLPLFKDKPSKQTKNSKAASMKSDVRLFARMYISCQTREGNLQDFFAHENQPFPPSLSAANGFMRHGTKSELMPCLERNVVIPVNCPGVSAVVLDGAATVQMLRPRGSKTFQDYNQDIFLPYVMTFLQKCK